VKAAADRIIDRLQFAPHQGTNALQRLATAVIATQAFVSPRE
jgi:hypothetical protein